jgi:hypothetical protein
MMLWTEGRCLCRLLQNLRIQSTYDSSEYRIRVSRNCKEDSRSVVTKPGKMEFSMKF